MAESIQRVLSVYDYLIFGGMLLGSALIGIYYAYRDRNSKRGTEGYLMAGRSMSVFPVACSLAVSFQSSLTVLGVPADVYNFGMMYVWMMFSLMFVSVVVSLVFIPTLYSLRISSINEYLERRFTKALRLTTTLIYLFQNFLYLGLNIYGPALALSEATGFGFVPAVLSVGLVCVFYTTLGGLKGVIWTDVFQGVIMLTGLTAFVIKASSSVGGISNAISIASDGGRTTIFRFNTDPRVRYSVWTTVIGSFVLWLGMFGSNQTQVQRLLSVKSRTKSRKALFLGVLGICVFTSLALICGLIMYAFYHECDPLSQGCIKVRDQLMPYAVMDLFRDWPGMAGLFLSCVFAASLSTVSSGFTSMITVTVEDLIKPFTNWSDTTYTWVSKGLGVFFGGATIGISFLVSVLGDLITVGVGAIGAVSGPSLGMFLLGIWFPFVNSAGAYCGFVGGIIFSMALLFGGRSIKKPAYLIGSLEVSTSNCPANCGYMDSVNRTVMDPYPTLEIFDIGSTNASMHMENTEIQGIDNFFALSFFYTSCVGLAATLIFGISCSLISSGWSQRHDVDTSLIRPPFQFSWLPEKIRSVLRCGIDWHDHEESDEDYDEKVEWKELNMKKKTADI